MTIKNKEQVNVKQDIALMQIAEQRAKRNIQIRLGFLAFFWKQLTTDAQYWDEFKLEYDRIKWLTWKMIFRTQEKILSELRYEEAEGVHTFTMCPCGRAGSRRYKCVICLREELGIKNVKQWERTNKEKR